MNPTSSSLLIVDDDRLTSSLLEYVFTRQQWSVVTLRDGQAALAFIESQAPVDVIVLELLLPHVGGLELLQDIRRDPRWQHTRVVILSAKNSITDLKQAFVMGADDYLVKPFDPEELVARVQRWVSRSS